MTTRIIGTGSYVPEHMVTNDDLAKIMDTSDEWIRSRTGIGARRIVREEGTSDMAEAAARKALEKAGVKPEELDIIIVGTSSPDQCFPCAACDVQARLGAVNAAAYDISCACSGFIFALNTVHAFFKAGIYKTGLVVGVDTVSKLVDWTDRATCVLFGDGAGAAVVRAEDTGILHMLMMSDGTKGPALACLCRSNGDYQTGRKPELGLLTMDGQEVFRFAVKTVPESIRQLLEESGCPIEDIKYFILHQANSRIIESVAKRLKVDMSKFPMNLEHYGNTSGASVPLMLDEVNQAGMLKRGDKIVMAGFGAGMTWGATLMEW